MLLSVYLHDDEMDGGPLAVAAQLSLLSLVAAVEMVIADVGQRRSPLPSMLLLLLFLLPVPQFFLALLSPQPLEEVAGVVVKHPVLQLKEPKRQKRQTLPNVVVVVAYTCTER